jgi:hypothetical protein
MSDLDRLRIWDDSAVRGALSWYLDVAENRRPAKFRIAATVATQLDPATSSEDALWVELNRLTPIFVARWQAIRAGAPLPQAAHGPSLLEHSRPRNGYQSGGGWDHPKQMSARCAALSVASGEKKYIDGACVLTDSDGDQIFSTFDTRDTDKSQPQMSCGTHIITGGTGKYKGITESEPFACISMPALAGPGGYTAMDIPHNTTWEIK